MRRSSRSRRMDRFRWMAPQFVTNDFVRTADLAMNTNSFFSDGGVGTPAPAECPSSLVVHASLELSIRSLAPVVHERDAGAHRRELPARVLAEVSAAIA